MLKQSELKGTKPRVVVYTANFGQKDKLRSPKNFDPKLLENIDFLCVTDDIDFDGDVYQKVVLKHKFSDLAKNARDVKINGCAGIENYDIAIWHDSSIQLDCQKIDELTSFADQNTLSTFKHGREDVYLEAIACIETNKDRPFRVAQQMKRYHEAGIKAHSGLFETGILVLNVKQYLGSQLQSLWWDEVASSSRRDQLSLPYAQMVSKTSIGVLEGSGHQNPYSEYIGHEYEHYVDDSSSWFSELNLLKKLAVRYIYKLRHQS